jgi:hypothetical protein
MNKKKIAFIVVIILMLSCLIPNVVEAAPNPGTLNCLWNGNVNYKPHYIIGAPLTLYWIGPEYTFAYPPSYPAYPISVPGLSGGGDFTQKNVTSWQMGWTLNTTWPSTLNITQPDGSRVTVTGITPEMGQTAINLAMIHGYPASAEYVNYGITPEQAFYVTNFTIQVLSGLLATGNDGASYNYTIGPGGSQNIMNFAYYMQKVVRDYLITKREWQPLNVSVTSNPTAYSNGYFYTDIIISKPSIDSNRYLDQYVWDNLGNLPAGSYFTNNTGTLNVSGYQSLRLYIPISSTTGGKTYTFALHGITKTSFAGLVIYRVQGPNWDGGWTDQGFVVYDPSEWTTSTQYTNTPTTIFSVTTPNLPDLTVDSVLTNKEPGKVFEAGETIRITAQISNIGTKATGTNTIVRLYQIAPDSLQPVGFDQGTAPVANTYDKTIGSLAPGASTIVSWDFVTPIRIEARNVDATVTADATNLVQEFYENNNSQTIKLTLNPGKPDFTADVYNMDNNTVLTAGYDAVVSAWIGNIGKISSPSVDVSMTINGQTYTENICVPTATRNYPTGNHPLGGNLVSFRFRTPDSPGTYQIVIKADPSNKIAEENETNNTNTITITVQAETVTPMVDAGDSSLKDNYNGSTVKPSYTSTNSLSWNEVRQTGTKTYETVSYIATLATNFTLSPGDYVAYPEPVRADVIESGFGLEADATVSLTSNCNDPDKLVGPQYLYVYYPETNYGNSSAPGFEYYHETMERISGTEYNGLWALQENQFSSLEYSRVHYTPLWYPDGQYTAVCMALNSWTPAGKLTYGTEDSVNISGDMYDRVSVVAR